MKPQQAPAKTTTKQNVKNKPKQSKSKKTGKENKSKERKSRSASPRRAKNGQVSRGGQRSAKSRSKSSKSPRRQKSIVRDTKVISDKAVKADSGTLSDTASISDDEPQPTVEVMSVTDTDSAPSLAEMSDAETRPQQQLEIKQESDHCRITLNDSFENEAHIAEHSGVKSYSDDDQHARRHAKKQKKNKEYSYHEDKYSSSHFENESKQTEERYSSEENTENKAKEKVSHKKKKKRNREDSEVNRGDKSTEKQRTSEKAELRIYAGKTEQKVTEERELHVVEKHDEVAVAETKQSDSERKEVVHEGERIHESGDTENYTSHKKKKKKHKSRKDDQENGFQGEENKQDDEEDDSGHRRKHKKHKSHKSHKSRKDKDADGELIEQINGHKTTTDSAEVSQVTQVAAFQSENDTSKGGTDGKPKTDDQTTVADGGDKRRMSFRDISLTDVINMDVAGPYTWDQNHKGKNMTISGNRGNVASRLVASKSTDGARGCQGYNIGYHEFKFSFSDKPWGSHCMVGLCTKDATLHADRYTHLLGADDQSWGWDIPSRTLYHGGKPIGTFPQNMSVENIPRSFCMILDLYSGVLMFDFGQEDVEEAFTGLPQLTTELFPAVALVYGRSSVTIYKMKCANQTEFKPGALDTVDEDNLSRVTDTSTAISMQTENTDLSQAPPMLKDLGRTFSSYHERQMDEGPIEEEESSETVYRDIEDLSEDDRDLITLGFGWDFVKRGGLVMPYPNIPRIAVPHPSLKDKVQSIRGKRGFKKNEGRHRWRIREIRFSSQDSNPAASEDYGSSSSANSSLIIGVASDEHRTFNHGFRLEQLGPHAWGFDPSSKLIWHKNYFHYSAEMPECYLSGVTDKEIDMVEGIEVELDTHRNTLTFSHKDEILAVMRRVYGAVLYPFLLFNLHAHHPVEITYLHGPQRYVDQLLAELHSMTSSDRDEVVSNVRCLVKRSSQRMTADAAPVTNYYWGNHSANITLNNKVVQSRGTQPGVVVAENFLSGGRHRIQFTVEGSAGHLVLGLVGDRFDQDTVLYDTHLLLGSNQHSWAWDVTHGLLYHGAVKLGRYPAKSGVSVTNIHQFILTLDFTHLGYNTASFSVVTRGVNGTDSQTDLGIAFVNLPEFVSPALVLSGSGDEETKVKMEYISGGWKQTSRETQRQYEVARRRNKSATCTML